MIDLRVPDPDENEEVDETADARLVAAERPMSPVEREVQTVMAVDLTDTASRARARKIVETLETSSAAAAKKRMLGRRILMLAQADSGSAKIAADLEAFSAMVRKLGLPHTSPRRKGLMGRLFKQEPHGEKAYERLYDARRELDGMVAALVKSAEVLRQNDVALKGYERDIMAEHEQIRADIALADSFEPALIGAIDEARGKGADTEIVRFAQSEVLFPLEQQRQSLQTLLAVNQQAALSLSVLRDTNAMLIQNIREIAHATRQSLGIAEMLHRSLEAQRDAWGFGEDDDARGRSGASTGVEGLQESIDELYRVLDRHDAWHEEASARTGQALGELRDLCEEV